MESNVADHGTRLKAGIAPWLSWAEPPRLPNPFGARLPTWTYSSLN